MRNGTGGPGSSHATAEKHGCMAQDVPLDTVSAYIPITMQATLILSQGRLAKP